MDGVAVFNESVRGITESKSVKKNMMTINMQARLLQSVGPSQRRQQRMPLLPRLSALR